MIFGRVADSSRSFLSVRLKIVFFTKTDEKLVRHRLTHSKIVGPTEELTISMGDLSEAMQAALIRDQRRRMEEPSLMYKRVERSRGLVSPPFRLEVKGVEATSEASPDEDVSKTDEPDEPWVTKAVPRRRKIIPRTPDVVPGPDEEISTTRRIRSKTGAHNIKRKEDKKRPYVRTTETHMSYMSRVLEITQTLPPPPRTGRPVYMTLERAAKLRPTARYIAEFVGIRQSWLMFFYELLQPMTGAVIRREEDDVPGSPVVAGIAVILHDGCPEARQVAQPAAYNWKWKATVYDVHSSPWTAVRKLQLSEMPHPGIFLVINPKTYVSVNTEIVHMH